MSPLKNDESPSLEFLSREQIRAVGKWSWEAPTEQEIALHRDVSSLLVWSETSENDRKNVSYEI